MNDLEKRRKAYGTCGECNEPGTGEEWCRYCNAKRLEVTLKIGQAEIRILTNLFNNHKLTPFIVKNVLNGYLSKNFKKLIILLGVVW